MSWLSVAWDWYSFAERASNGTTEHPHAALVNPVAAGIGALLLIYAAIRQARVATRQAEIATRQAEVASLRHEAQTKADQQHRITESYSKAVEQLAQDKIEVRLGGIYTLERISRESPEDYWTVMETLCAFVRERSRWKASEEAVSETADEESGVRQNNLPTDIAAVLAVIIRRDAKNQQRESDRGWRLNLAETDLHDANLRRANLHNADLSGANLFKAYLSGANLSGANLNKANLCRANLYDANLRAASLNRADLLMADLRETDLRGAQLVKAILSGAHLIKANLSGAALSGANLIAANLNGVNLSEAFLDWAILGAADFSGARACHQLSQTTLETSWTAARKFRAVFS